MTAQAKARATLTAATLAVIAASALTLLIGRA